MPSFDIYRELERSTKVRFLTCEAEILLSLAQGARSAGELAAQSKNSSTSFYMTLKRLHQMGLIIGTESAHDKRRIVYHLPQDLGETLGRATVQMQPA
jgi:DNA-binding MarR family transcriptional regulator